MATSRKKSSYQRSCLIVSRTISSGISSGLPPPIDFASINSRLDRYVSQINKLIPALAPNVSLHPVRRYVSPDYPLAKHMDQTTRVVINTDGTQFSRHFSKESIGISHIIEIRPTDQMSENWVVSTDSDFDASVTSGIPKVPYLLEDLCLDLVFFYTWRAVFSKYTDIDKKEEFSKAKVDYFRRSRITHPYGIVGSDIRFVTLSSLARDNDFGIDFTRLVNLWKDFFTQLVDGFQLGYERQYQGELVLRYFEKGMCDRALLPAVEQLKYFFFYKQLPLSLIKLVATLGNGDYIVVRINKRLSPKQVDQLKPIFGFRPKLGRTVVASGTKYKELRQFFPVLAFFYLKVV